MRPERPVLLVALGTALVLVTYVTPMSTVPATAADLGSGSGARAWILSSMSVGLAAGLLASGALGDARGRRRVYVGGLAVMGLGALLCALAPVSAVFVGARVVEGLGGAAVLSCGLAILAHTFTDPVERGRATGVWGASVGLGITVGALLAAGLDVGTGWREGYALTAVLVLALVVPSARGLGESRAAHPRRLDVAGTIALAGGLTLLVAGLTGIRAGLSPLVVALLALAVASLVAFVVVERRVAEPMVELRLLAEPGFLAATVGALGVGLGIIAMTSNVPLVVQLGLGEGVWTATWLILVWSATSVGTSLLVRRVALPLSGSATLGVALVVVGAGQLLGLGLTTGSSAWRLVPALAVAGLATGVLNAGLGREAVAHVPPDRAAMGSGTNNTARYLGAACGITLFSVLVQHAGPGAGAAAVVDGWQVAVVVAAALSWAAAVVVLVAARRGARTH
ncbi:MFS transporter [Nocardioides scoriae]|uniref:MFS transporter n=1 Tax=Nocardioides scoriae TaxID=642780 RepID=UPI000B89E3D1